MTTHIGTLGPSPHWLRVAGRRVLTVVIALLALLILAQAAGCVPYAGRTQTYGRYGQTGYRNPPYRSYDTYGSAYSDPYGPTPYYGYQGWRVGVRPRVIVYEPPAPVIVTPPRRDRVYVHPPRRGGPDRVYVRPRRDGVYVTPPR